MTSRKILQSLTKRNISQRSELPPEVVLNIKIEPEDSDIESNNDNEEIASSTSKHELDRNEIRPFKRLKLERGEIFEQFQIICKRVEISDQDFSDAVQIKNEIEEIFSRRFRTVRVFMFRNWFLQLKDPSGNDTLLFYIYTKGGPPDYFRPVSISNLKKTITHFPDSFYGISQFRCGGLKHDVGLPFTHIPTRLQFRLAREPHLIGEVQISRLLLYFCQFDPRVKPLMSLLYNWVNVNNLGQEDGHYPHYDRQRYRLQRQIKEGLELLLISFLCREEAVPTPAEAMFRYKSVCTSGSIRMNPLGFLDWSDPEFIENWSNENTEIPDDENCDMFVISVLELLQKFFAFCNLIFCDPCVINGRDGEIIKMRDFLYRERDNVKFRTSTNLTWDEISKARNELFLNHKCALDSMLIVMLHPLIPKWGMLVVKSVFISKLGPIMTISGCKIHDFLSSKQAVEVNLEEILHVTAKPNNFLH